MNRLEHLLTIAGEEGSEVAQRASKANRFGLKEVEPGQKKDNVERLLGEFFDLVAMIDMLEDEGHLKVDLEVMGKHIEKKKAQVEKFLLYSKEQGTLTE